MNNSTNFGIISKHLKNLRPIIFEYLKIIQSTVELWEYEDLPWWYNERANLSLFTGAIWKSGGYAIEEYASDKIRAKKKYEGRNDLYFVYGEQDYISEAKITSLNGNSSPVNIQSNVQKYLNKASADVKKNKLGVPAYRLGLLFVVPYFLVKSNSIQKDFEKFLSAVKKVDYNTLGWFYSEDANKQVIDKKWVSPGVVILVKKVL